jgi:hypothetical protein
MGLLRAMTVAEVMVAVRVCAFGRWWAQAAARRLGKISGIGAEGLK